MKRVWEHWEGVFWVEEMPKHIIPTDLDIYIYQNANANSTPSSRMALNFYAGLLSITSSLFNLSLKLKSTSV